jgi:flagellin
MKGMRINSNISALNAWKNLSATDVNLGRSLARLSSGLRITKAADDAAGLAISEKMRGQIRGLNMARRNAQDGISLIQTAEGALNETHNILQRMRELAVQAASGTLTSDDRNHLQAEVAQLIEEIDGIATRTEFNTLRLLVGDGSTPPATGSAAPNFTATLQIGANATQTLPIAIADMRARALGVNNVNVVTGLRPDPDTTGPLTEVAALAAVDTAINTVSTQRANLGAFQNRLESTIANLASAAENITAAESRIRDADMALEMATFTRHQILLQSGTAMLAQANMKPQSVLQLLG